MAIVVGLTTVAYAALQTQLNISGYVNQKGGTWDIHFENVSNITTTGQGELKESAIQTTGTDLYFSADLVENGDSVSFTIDVVNGGSRDARLVSGSMMTTDYNGLSTGYELDGNEGVTTIADLNVFVTWQDGINITGNPTTGDLLNAGETKTLLITVTRNSTDTLESDRYFTYKLDLNFQQT